ncbi:MAG: T9SS type A sorting domain-containing protein [Chitinophagales bacterium]
MKKLNSLLLAITLLPFTASTYGQVAVHPVLSWEVESAIGEGAADGVAFLDYFEDFCVSQFQSALGSSATSINSDGSINYIDQAPGPSGSIYGPISNMGTATYFYWINPWINQLTAALCTNENINEVIATYTYTIPANYSNFEFKGLVTETAIPMENHMILLSTLDNNDGKPKGLLIPMIVNLITESATFQNIPINVGSWATFPSSITADGSELTSDFYVWGYFNKDAGGINHDNFITKVHADGEIWSAVYTKSHASYAGRDDEATGIGFDSDGNLFAVSQSEDNVAPYYEHIAIFRINPANGKRIWLKRIGTALVYHEYAHGLTFNNMGTGLAITGSVADAGAGRNARTWRLDEAGNILWTKTINMTGTGTIEEGRAIGFCPETGDVNIMGLRGSDGTFFVARYDSETGAPAWPTEVYDGDYAGYALNSHVAFQFGPGGDLYCGYVVQSGPDEAWVITKYEQLPLRENNEINSNTIALFPNPASTILNIKGADLQSLIQIFNAEGQLVKEAIAQDETTTINIQSLPNGLYSLINTMNGERKSASFIHGK